MVLSWVKRGSQGEHKPSFRGGEGVSAILLSEAGFPEGGSSSALCGLAVLSYNDQHRGDEVMFGQ